MSSSDAVSKRQKIEEEEGRKNSIISENDDDMLGR